MALSGDLAGMPPSDLLQLLALGTKSGILSLHCDEEMRNLFIFQGKVAGVN